MSKYVVFDDHFRVKLIYLLSPLPVSSKRFTLTILAPLEVHAKPVNEAAVEVTWTSPTDSNGIDNFYAFLNGATEKHCAPDNGETSCLIGELEVCTKWNICVVACNVSAATSTSTASTITPNPNIGRITLRRYQAISAAFPFALMLALLVVVGALASSLIYAM